jgi:hypothetical protein
MLHLNCNFSWDFHFVKIIAFRKGLQFQAPIGITSCDAFPEPYHFSKAGAVLKRLHPEQQINPKTGGKTEPKDRKFIIKSLTSA